MPRGTQDQKSTKSDLQSSQTNTPTGEVERDPKQVQAERDLFKRLASIRQFPIAPDPDMPEEPNRG